MELRRRRTRGASSPMTALLFCACLCFFSASALFSSSCSNKACEGGGTPRTISFSERKEMRELGWAGGGPGSYPPRCASKCGECTPCCPVHVPVPPGTPVITEYYPEAWRCKCGNRLYMP